MVCPRLVGAHFEPQRLRKLVDTYPFVEVVTAELDSGIGDDADAVGSITTHEAPPTLLLPHLL